MFAIDFRIKGYKGCILHKFSIQHWPSDCISNLSVPNRQEIHKRVGYAIKLGIYEDYGIAHYKYNEAANIKDHNTCNNLALFNKKLQIINNDINNLTKH